MITSKSGTFKILMVAYNVLISQYKIDIASIVTKFSRTQEKAKYH